MLQQLADAGLVRGKTVGVDATTLEANAAVWPGRVYAGADGARRRPFVHRLPLALDAERATFVFVQPEEETQSALRTWGGQHAGLWAALLAAGRVVEVVVVGRNPERLAGAGQVLDGWGATPAAVDAQCEWRRESQTWCAVMRRSRRSRRPLRRSMTPRWRPMAA